uniref:EF-hand domain-containing protein n=2 Tax=Octactis speculum TaxID=3111310 RepID=A0A7S2MTP1_9STRA|mmetsp:Transcript_9871/g.12875  ORF Transcript_9871/g.12875 Transcript_9871/m.12875 type:complete len:314 (+) Transcript_9871:105-1046(+)
MRTKAISIVGSERTMCFEIITDSSNSMEARDRIFSALELLRYSFKRLLANFGGEDQEVENIKNGRIILPLSRHYDYLLKPRNDRRVDEQAVIALQSTVGIMAAVTIDEEMLQRPITEEDRARYKRSFRLFDKDGSGSIDAMELMKAMNELGRPTNLDQSIKIIREFDADNSGTIEENEFIGMMRQTYQDDEAVESLLVLYNKLYPHKRLISKDEFSSVMNLYATYKDPQDINPPFLYKKFKSGPRIFYYYDEDPEIKVKRKRKELARDRTVTAEDDRLSQENLKSLAEFADVDADGLIYPQDYTHWLVQSLAD